jgi:hypothetical protein
LRRQSPCATDTCWFSIDSIEIDADSFSGSGYIGRDMHGSMAYQGFGSFDSTTYEGMLAEGMFGIDVSMEGLTPSTSFQNYDFRMANSGDAVFDLSSGFQILDAHFAWDDHELTITSDPGNCVCINCTL